MTLTSERELDFLFVNGKVLSQQLLWEGSMGRWASSLGPQGTSSVVCLPLELQGVGEGRQESLGFESLGFTGLE